MPDYVYVTFDDSGGMFHYATSLAGAVKQLSSVALAVFSAKAKEDVDNKNLDEFIVLEKPTGNGFFGKLQKYNYFYYRKKAKELVAKTQPRLLHVTSSCNVLYSFLKSISGFGVKIVYTVHDPALHEENRTLWGRFFSFYQHKYQLPKVFMLVDAIHVHSEKHREFLVMLYGSWIGRKIYVVQHGGGVPSTILSGSQSITELERLNSGDYFLLFFGRVHPYKGLEILEKAINIVRKRGCRIKLIIAGQGNLGALFSDENSDNIIINRFIEDNEVNHLFKVASVVVLPYLSATQSGVIPLAQAYGKPVICTDVGALSELIVDGETGLVVPSQDEEALADAITVLMNLEARMLMSAAAINYIDTHASWKIIAEEHIGEYKKLKNTKKCI